MKNSMLQVIPSLFFVVSLLLFLYKGIAFALLGSYVPLLISVCFASFIMVSKVKSATSFHVAKKIWAYTIISWCVIRIILAILIVTTLNEAYLLDQINWANLALTIFLIMTAYLLLKTKNRT